MNRLLKTGSFLALSFWLVAGPAYASNSSALKKQTKQKSEFTRELLDKLNQCLNVSPEMKHRGDSIRQGVVLEAHDPYQGQCAEVELFPTIQRLFAQSKQVTSPSWDSPGFAIELWERVSGDISLAYAFNLAQSMSLPKSPNGKTDIPKSIDLVVQGLCGKTQTNTSCSPQMRDVIGAYLRENTSKWNVPPINKAQVSAKVAPILASYQKQYGQIPFECNLKSGGHGGHWEMTPLEKQPQAVQNRYSDYVKKMASLRSSSDLIAYGYTNAFFQFLSPHAAGDNFKCNKNNGIPDESLVSRCRETARVNTRAVFQPV